MSINIQRNKTKRRTAMSSNYGYNVTSVLSEVHMDATIVQQVLETCIAGTNIVRMAKKARILSYYNLKKYLFYLITFDLISYNGKKKIYRITKNGKKLLLMINESMSGQSSSKEDIVICN